MHGQFTRERDSLHSVVLHDGKPRSARGSRPERFEQLRASLSLQDPAQTGAIPTAAFRAVLQRYWGVRLSESELEMLERKYQSPGQPGMIAYRLFLQKVRGRVGSSAKGLLSPRPPASGRSSSASSSGGGGARERRRRTFALGNEYLQQQRVARRLAPSAPPGFGKRFSAGQSESGTGESLAQWGTLSGDSHTERSSDTEPSAAEGASVVEGAAVAAVAEEGWTVAHRCAKEFGRDLAETQAVLESFRVWVEEVYDAGRGFEIPCLGRVVVRRTHASFVGSQRALARYGLTQRAPAAPMVHHTASRNVRVDYSLLSQRCGGLEAKEVLREVIWCFLNTCAETPETEVELDLGPVTLCCQRRRLHIRQERMPGGRDQSGEETPPIDRPTSVDSRASSVASSRTDWTVSSFGQSVAGWGAWGSLPDADWADLGVKPRSIGSETGGTWSADHEVTQLSAANATLGVENAMLRRRLNNLLAPAREMLTPRQPASQGTNDVQGTTDAKAGAPAKPGKDGELSLSTRLGGAFGVAVPGLE